jgi:hypothetical protein
MKIEAGKYYRTRGGQVFGPMMRDDDPHGGYPWRLSLTSEFFNWTEEGLWMTCHESPFDLVAEVYASDTPPADAPSFIHPMLDGPSGPFLMVPEAKTLRDEFAMRLMERDAFMVGYKEHAEQLYRAADAMMEARKK